MPYTPKHLERWARPDGYIGADWPDYYVFLSQHRDSDLVTRENFRAAFAEFATLPPFDPPADNPEADSRMEVCENHWAVGWVSWIALHASDEAGLRAADDMAARLESYPLLDEDAYCAAEWEEWCEAFDNLCPPLAWLTEPMRIKLRNAVAEMDGTSADGPSETTILACLSALFGADAECDFCDGPALKGDGLCRKCTAHPFRALTRKAAARGLSAVLLPDGRAFVYHPDGTACPPHSIPAPPLSALIWSTL